MNIPSAEPIRDLGRRFQAHADRLDMLITHLERRARAFQEVYQGDGSQTYHATTARSLRKMRAAQAYSK